MLHNYVLICIIRNIERISITFAILEKCILKCFIGKCYLYCLTALKQTLLFLITYFNFWYSGESSFFIHRCKCWLYKWQRASYFQWKTFQSGSVQLGCICIPFQKDFTHTLNAQLIALVVWIKHTDIVSCHPITVTVQQSKHWSIHIILAKSGDKQFMTKKLIFTTGIIHFHVLEVFTIILYMRGMGI